MQRWLAVQSFVSIYTAMSSLTAAVSIVNALIRFCVNVLIGEDAPPNCHVAARGERDYRSS